MEPSMLAEQPANILIVDDQVANLQVLAEILKSKGHKVRPAPSGKLALAAVEHAPPDLILLDIMMPEMDGYEVCRHLKEHATLKQIPVIFISALDDTAAKVRGFEAGGVDYIPKPFQAAEVLARVDAHLRLHYYRNALAEKTRQLEISYDQLREVESMRDQLTHMIVHDMRNLLNGVMGYLYLLQKASASKADEASVLYLQKALKLVNGMTAMATNLLDISKMEAKEISLHLAPCDLTGLVSEAIEKLEATREGRNISWDVPPHPVQVEADRDLLLRVIINLLDNAIKFTGAGGTIVLGVESVDDRVRFFIQDNGPGIPMTYQEKIFEKFGQVKLRQSGRKSSTGLGLAFCKLAITAHRGEIWVKSEEGSGSTFIFEIPGK